MLRFNAHTIFFGPQEFESMSLLLQSPQEFLDLGPGPHSELGQGPPVLLNPILSSPHGPATFKSCWLPPPTSPHVPFLESNIL